MIEIMIERWSQRDGSTDWLWSIWQDGERKHMGPSQPSVASAEMEARAGCQKLFGWVPDDVTIL
ncbi:MAG: hypothetical protein VYA17_10470 [Pseudomonadota bacterium]|nr:hypothetical protein [Pseudomonadota bacterium]